MENKYNLRSPAVKRLMKEAAELRDPTEHYHAQPLEPNGRFEVGKKICLSISGHHPETWQPSWSIRTALIAIIGFMPTKGEGAIGSLDYTPEERRTLAKRSQEFYCETCDCSMRSALLALTLNSKPSAEDHKAKELAQQINFKADSMLSMQTSENGSADRDPSAFNQWDTFSSEDQEALDQLLSEQAETSQSTEIEGSLSSKTSSTFNAQQHCRKRQHSSLTLQQNLQAQTDSREPAHRPVSTPVPYQPQDERHAGPVLLIVVLTLALAALIFRRIFLAQNFKFDYEL
ncbi:ubiquitin-conjugating enzyme E2 J1 isoform X2 [Betta splendens]|uniref:Ubiquitin-conjugating enzyme E2 J1 isoform X2 n=1 Tax=Betta splendens TaxID=158456 RepID=A0A8M1HAV6_BETSP|nr:ubiquitin-conjugating enzyme E2 J1 isoform X2 [Betta splendens]